MTLKQKFLCFFIPVSMCQVIFMKYTPQSELALKPYVLKA